MPRIRRENFVLHAVPAVNLFTQDADPISVNNRTSSYLLRPAVVNPAHCQVYSVDRVTGYTRASRREREYLPFELFSGNSGKEPVYQVQLTKSEQHDGCNLYLGLSYPDGLPDTDAESLSINLTCSNGSLPESLRIGDISEALLPLPDLVSARNITRINPGQNPPQGSGLLRQLTSHLYLNHLSLERVEHLRALLELYVFPGQHSGSDGAANLKRIAGIESMCVTAGKQLVNGIPMRGREICIKVRQDHFAGAGDMYLFGCLLDQFLGRYAALNCYTRLEFHETLRGGTWQWPTRLGNQPRR